MHHGPLLAVLIHGIASLHDTISPFPPESARSRSCTSSARAYWASACYWTRWNPRGESYAAIEIADSVGVDDVDVAVAEVALRAEVDGEVEEVEAVADVRVHDLQQDFLREAGRYSAGSAMPTC